MPLGEDTLIANSIARLEAALNTVPEQFQALHDEVYQARTPGKWSRLQILGHLCDSALNNVSRFIQLQQSGIANDSANPPSITPYNQNQWVDAQQYNNAPIEDVIRLWFSLNQAILRVIAHLSQPSLDVRCKLPDGQIVTLEWLIQDYVAHMEHHLHQIFSNHNILSSSS